MKKNIKNLLIGVSKLFDYILLKIIDQVELNRAKKAISMAEKLHIKDGKRYLVIKHGSRYLVMNNNDRKFINARSPKNERVSFVMLMKNAVYTTP